MTIISTVVMRIPKVGQSVQCDRNVRRGFDRLAENIKSAGSLPSANIAAANDQKRPTPGSWKRLGVPFGSTCSDVWLARKAPVIFQPAYCAATPYQETTSRPWEGSSWYRGTLGRDRVLLAT